MAKLKREDRSEATLAKTEWLLGFANPEFGDEPIREITAPVILKVLQALETRARYESARRLRSTVGSVFRYAIATARAETDPTYALRGALTQVRPTPRGAITDADKFGALLRAIDAFDGQPGTRIALRLLALLFPRPGELRLAQWSEFDLERAVWTVPASRMRELSSSVASRIRCYFAARTLERRIVGSPSNSPGARSARSLGTGPWRWAWKAASSAKVSKIA